MKRKETPKIAPDEPESSGDTIFVRATKRGWAGTRKHAAGGLIALVVSAITGTVIPMLNQWHEDAQINGDIQAVEIRCNREIDDLKEQNKAAITALWNSNRDLRNRLDKLAHDSQGYGQSRAVTPDLTQK